MPKPVLTERQQTAVDFTVECNVLPTSAYDPIFGSAGNRSEQLKRLCDMGVLTSIPDPVRRPGRPSLYYTWTPAAVRVARPFGGVGPRPSPPPLSADWLLNDRGVPHLLEVGALAGACLFGLPAALAPVWHGEASGRMPLAPDDSNIAGTYVEPDGVLAVTTGIGDGAARRVAWIEHDRGSEHEGKWRPKLERYTRLAWKQPAAWARYGPAWPAFLITCVDRNSMQEIAGYFLSVADNYEILDSWAIYFAVYREVAAPDLIPAAAWTQLRIPTGQLGGERWTLEQILGAAAAPTVEAPARPAQTLAPPVGTGGRAAWAVTPPRATMRYTIKEFPTPIGVSEQQFYLDLPPDLTVAQAQANAARVLDAVEASAREVARQKYVMDLQAWALAEELRERQAKQAAREERAREAKRQKELAAEARVQAEADRILRLERNTTLLRALRADQAASYAAHAAYRRTWRGHLAVGLIRWEPFATGYLWLLWAAVWLAADDDLLATVRAALAGGPADLAAVAHHGALWLILAAGLHAAAAIWGRRSRTWRRDTYLPYARPLLAGDWMLPPFLWVQAVIAWVVAGEALFVAAVFGPAIVATIGARWAEGWRWVLSSGVSGGVLAVGAWALWMLLDEAAAHVTAAEQSRQRRKLPLFDPNNSPQARKPARGGRINGIPIGKRRQAEQHGKTNLGSGQQAT